MTPDKLACCPPSWLTGLRLWVFLVRFLRNCAGSKRHYAGVEMNPLSFRKGGPYRSPPFRNRESVVSRRTLVKTGLQLLTPVSPNATQLLSKDARKMIGIELGCRRFATAAYGHRGEHLVI